MGTRRGRGAGGGAEGPVAVVTGASRGLGAALADELARRGYCVAACARTRPAGAYSLCSPVDVADPGSVDRFAADVHDRLGPIAVWVNNAAVLGPIGPVRSTDLDAWTEALHVNVLAAVAGSRAFLQRRTDDAILVNVASRVVRSGVAGLAAYAATKAALVSLTESVAREEESNGVRAVAVIPPSIATDMQATLLAADPAEFPGVADAWKRRDSGEIVSAPFAAALLLDAALDAAATSTVVDLSAHREV